VGESYNIGGRAERRNIDVVLTICKILDEKRPRQHGKTYSDLIKMVSDRPGHDRRYAIDASKIERDLGWKAIQTFESGLVATIDWYLANAWWWQPIREKDAGKRIGLAPRGAPLKGDCGTPEAPLRGA
jgi:dTDP-glucose 4,6-dehydratase